jgi:predicted O-methyltransferase YrrM
MKNDLKKMIWKSITMMRPLANKIPWFQEVYAKLNGLEAPPGHFYSPFPDLEAVRLKEKEIFETRPREIPGINLNEEHQLQLFRKFIRYYNEQPFTHDKSKDLRFYFNNILYSYPDAITLFCMMRHYQPKKIVEVGGSGYSSCLILDTNERFLGNNASCICIEPYPKNIFALLTIDEEENYQLIQKPVQEVGLEIFQELSCNDILFIDSTHTAKVGSDVNHLLFHIIPSLKSGVLIHFHDVFYPFEYPKEWVYNGRAWNETYILRSFLQYNDKFEIEFFNTFLQHFHHNLFAAEMPLCLKGIEYNWNGINIWSGGSIWLRKL